MHLCEKDVILITLHMKTKNVQFTDHEDKFTYPGTIRVGVVFGLRRKPCPHYRLEGIREDVCGTGVPLFLSQDLARSILRTMVLCEWFQTSLSESNQLSLCFTYPQQCV